MENKIKTPAEKIAYMKGLMDGLKLADEDTAKVLRGILDVLSDMAADIDGLADYCDELSEEVEELDYDLSVVEDDLYDDEDDDDLDEFDDDSEYYEVECPNCGDRICVSEDILIEGGIDCPSCGKKLEFDFSTLTVDEIEGDDGEDDDEDDDL